MLHAALLLNPLFSAACPSPLEEKASARAPAEQPGACGIPALLSWADIDGDSRLELVAVGREGTLQIFANSHDGRFEDVTENVGLAGIGNAGLAQCADYDSDGRLDLFIGACEGRSRLFRNEGGVFVDMSTASGLEIEGAVRSARWLDLDGDERLDLLVVTAEKSRLFRGLEGGLFESSELPVAGLRLAPVSSELPVETDDVRDHVRGVAPTPSEGSSAGIASPSGAGVGQSVTGSTSSGGRAGLILAPSAIDDWVDEIGDTMTGTLTLAPSGDQALDVNTGSIYKGGALFLHSKGGIENTALGQQALSSVTSGANNTASGFKALYSNTSGFSNTACGDLALRSNVVGSRNTAIGKEALLSNTSSYNTAVGYRALRSNTSGFANTASGNQALGSNTTGSNNTAFGSAALISNTTGSRNTATGVEALRFNTGSNNTANGYHALQLNGAGSTNTAMGFQALRFSTTATGNTATGYKALVANTTGNFNTAIGRQALELNTTGYNNVAVGRSALDSVTTGIRNIALGESAGGELTTGNDNIAIGHFGVSGEGNTIRIGTAGLHTRAFVAGIRGATTGIANAIPVLIDSAGQLGTASSSRRFKDEIRDMGDATERLLALRPVVFRYKPEVQSGERPLEYGLIAEEVAKVFPDLVVYDEEGEPFTIKYHLLSSMLLNELQKQALRLEEQADDLERLHELEKRIAALEDGSG